MTTGATKVVGIIGTGATAVQCVPHLGATAEHLYVFQRTPSSIDVRNNRPTDPSWAESLAPGWQKRRMENFNNLVSGILEPEDLVSDGWTDIIGKLLTMSKSGQRELLGGSPGSAIEMADFAKMEQIRSRVDALVADPTTAELLKPYYRQFCKRPCFHDDYLQTFNRPNVTLVDTDGKGIDRITDRGVVANGIEYETDHDLTPEHIKGIGRGLDEALPGLSRDICEAFGADRMTCVCTLSGTASIADNARPCIDRHARRAIRPGRLLQPEALMICARSIG